MNNIKMVVCDLDGTLLDRNNRLSDYSVMVVNKIIEKGIIFVISTGRNYYSTKQMVDILNLKECNSYFIGSNGQQLYSFKSKQMDKEKLISESEAFEIRQLLHKSNLNTFIFYDKKMYCTVNKIFKIAIKLRFLLDRINEAISDEGAANYVNIPASTEIEGDVNKICFMTTNTKKAERIRLKLQDNFEVLCLKNVWYEIMPIKINKGLMLSKIMLAEGVKANELMVFGDGENDISMLKLTEYSFAMKNAMQSVKKACNYEADSNKNDGVAKTLEEYLLKI